MIFAIYTSSVHNDNIVANSDCYIQIEKCKDAIELQEWVYLHEPYVDVNCDPSIISDRPRLSELLKHLDLDIFDGIAVYEQNKLTADPVIYNELKKLILSRNKSLYVVHNPNFTGLK
jgi:hypothetical protein